MLTSCACAEMKHMHLRSQAVHVQVADLVKEVCRALKKDDSAAMPDTYLTALQNAFQRHLSDDQSRQSLQDFTTMCTRVAQTYAGFNASATALLHIAQVTHCPHYSQLRQECLGVVLNLLQPGTSCNPQFESCQECVCLMFDT